VDVRFARAQVDRALNIARQGGRAPGCKPPRSRDRDGGRKQTSVENKVRAPAGSIERNIPSREERTVRRDAEPPRSRDRHGGRRTSVAKKVCSRFWCGPTRQGRGASLATTQRTRRAEVESSRSRDRDGGGRPIEQKVCARASSVNGITRTLPTQTARRGRSQSITSTLRSRIDCERHVLPFVSIRAVQGSRLQHRSPPNPKMDLAIVSTYEKLLCQTSRNESPSRTLSGG
jgi:hypothetical protein